MKVKKLSDLPIPARQTTGAAGYDLQSDKDFTINPMQRVLVPTGYAFEIPIGKVGIIKDRSSMAYKYGISTLAGVIDSDYRDEVKILLINLSGLAYKVSKGDRIAQMVVVDHYSEELELVEQLDDFDRKGGFGSTGQ
jgi:dUTP pyrophosphatase